MLVRHGSRCGPLPGGSKPRVEYQAPKRPSCASRLLQALWRNKSRLIIFFLFCTNAVTVFTIYSNMPFMSPTTAGDVEESLLLQQQQGQQEQGPQQQVRQQEQGQLQDQGDGGQSTGQGGAAQESTPPVLLRSFQRGHGLQGFVFFSAYRMEAHQFVAIGLSALATHDLHKADACRWRQPNGIVLTNGTIETAYPGDTHDKAYEIMLLICTLQGEVPGSVGGQLEMSIGREDVVVYGEPPGTNLAIHPGPPFKSQLAYCSSPIYGQVNGDRIIEWMEFHQRVHGVDFFHLYDAGGIDDALLRRLRPYHERGQLSITDISDMNVYDTWLYAQLLVINDCAYRTRFSAKWALLLDLDEFLYVNPSPHSLSKLYLAPNEDAPWVTFGSMFFFSDKCTHSSNATRNPWEIERMVFRQSQVHCRAPSKYESANKCLAFDGHRKYAVNPRKVELCGIHKVVRPLTGGVHTNSDDVHLNHYRGINALKVKTCKQFIHDTDWIPTSWARDFTISRVAAAARKRKGGSL